MNRCKANIQPRDSYSSWHPSQCSRAAVRDGFCKVHHPDAVKERTADSMKRYEADLDARRKDGLLRNAAPLLYEALEDLVSVCDEGDGYAYANAKAALAKARGEKS